MRGYIGDFTKNGKPATWTLFANDEPKSVLNIAMNFIPQISVGLDVYFESDNKDSVISYYGGGLNTKTRSEILEILSRMEY